MTSALPERIARRITESVTGCWEWTGTHNRTHLCLVDDQHLHHEGRRQVLSNVSPHSQAPLTRQKGTASRMTDQYTALTGTVSTNEIQAAIDAGTGLAEPHPLDRDGRFFSVVSPAGAEHEVVDVEALLDRFRPTPRRKTGTYTAHTPQTFVNYVTKHGHGSDVTEIWGSLTDQTVVAVLNAHAKGDTGEPGWGDHRILWRLQQTPAWKSWNSNNRKLLTQVDFAEHVQDRRLDVIEPDDATLAEIAHTFKAKKSVQFHESRHVSTGQVQLQYHEEIDAKAGAQGNIDVPETFTLALQPFEGSDRYRMPARLRFDISTGQLRISYVLDRPEEILRQAFSDELGAIEAGTGASVFRGTPATPA